MKLSSRAVTGIVGCASVLFIFATACTNTTEPKSAFVDTPSSTSEVISDTISSEASSVSAPVSSQKGENSVADTSSSTKQVQKSTVTTNKATEQTEAEPVSSAALKKQPAPKYAVIDPETGLPVWSDNKDYEKFKAQLGGDAGTVPPDKSSAVQAALANLPKNTKSSSPASSAQ